MEIITNVKAKTTFDSNLKHLMEVNDGLSYADLASKIGSTKQQVSNIFNRDPWVSHDTVEAVAKAFKIEETDLFDPKFPERYKKKNK